MNNEEAKFILQAYRPNGADAGDATFCAALDQAKADPQLGRWLERSRAFDTAISAKLDQIQVPAGLREAILAGGRATAPATTQRAWWRSPVLMASAAGLALLFAVGLALWPKAAAADTPLALFALNDALGGAPHGGHGTDTDKLQAMLSAPGTRLSQGLPVDFNALHKAGCRSVSFQGREVLEVCFQRDGAWFHCYIARRTDFPSLVAAVSPVFSDRKGVSVASWADASHLFVVISETGRAPLERLL